jgi:hypothetical protein
MQDFLRDRLTEDEIETYETYDGLALLCSQFLVWPALVALICFGVGQTHIALVCVVIALIALPLMLVTGQKARAILKIAEERYIALVGGGSNYQPPY